MSRIKGIFRQMTIAETKIFFVTPLVKYCVCITLLLIWLFCGFSFAASEAEGALQETELVIHLPRKISIETGRFNLGQIGIIQGEALLCEKANKVSLGRISLPGQKVSVDRTVVLSRLASSGISRSEVTITGAENTVVTQKHNVIGADQFIEAAKSFLKRLLSSDSLREIKAVSKPSNLLIPQESGELKLTARLLNGRGKGRARVQVRAMNESTTIGTRLIIFRMKYNRPIPVASAQIPKGMGITKDNVTIKHIVSDAPKPANWRPPYGSIARQTIDVNSVITSDMLRTLRAEVVIKRGKRVSISVQIPGLMVSALGEALQQGRTGEYIKVRNVDSKRIIIVRVKDDGTVEPVF